MYAGHRGSYPGAPTGVFARRSRSPQSSMLQVEFSQLSDTGRRREQNEDYIGHVVPETPELARSRGWLFALADGVGGQDRGEVASRTAVESLLAGFLDADPGDLPTSLFPPLIHAATTHFHDAPLRPRT